MAAPGHANARYEALLAELDSAISALQRHHELYFLGLERKEPRQDRDNIKQQIQALKRENIRNTALKFRLNSLWSKFLAYERMWLRTITEIEEGRYHRDVYKAKLRSKDRQELGELKEAQEKGMAAAEGIREELAAEKKGGKRPAARNGQGASTPTISDAKLQQLYSAFVTAKKRCKEDTAGISLEAMRKSLNKQIPAIKAKHNAKAVDFKVVIKGGKAVLKAVPRTG